MAKRDQPTMTFSFSLCHSSPKSLAKPFFSFSLCLSLHVPQLVLYSIGVMIEQQRDACRLCWNVELNGPVWLNGMRKCCMWSRPKGEIESFRVGKAHWGIVLFPLSCGLESFIGLAVLPEVCVYVFECVYEYACMYVFVWRRFPCVQYASVHASMCP